MKHRILAVLAALAMLLTFAPAVEAGTQGSCPPSDHDYVILYENITTDHGDGDDRVFICSSNSNLTNADHTLPGTCANGQFQGGNDWNDCASSVWVVLSGNTSKFCIYKDLTYQHVLWTWTGPFDQRQNLTAIPGANDQVTSLKVGVLASCP